jgi:leucyl-tRNA synthetase
MSRTPPARSAPAGPERPRHGFRYTAALAAEIEARWQRRWEEERTFAAPNPGQPGFDPAARKLYVLDMFPYPSGVGLHVGHPMGYIATDIYCRYQRMRGCNVLHPMGFDAFGLPAEQFAVEHGVHPRLTTQRNIANMVRQLKALGLSYDWGRTLATTEPRYYRWTQWIFLQLHRSWFDPAERRARPATGADADRPRLAYMAEVPVNWCPALGTVLANEEVTADGRSERGNHPVYKRPLRQWMLRITAYAERLAEDLDLVEWPEPIKLMQRNWIGRSEGALIDFPVAGKGALRVFTTRPDTIFGATYMVLAPEHPLVESLATPETRRAVAAYRAEAAARSDVQRQADAGAGRKTGVFTGSFALNPATGKPIPVWIADYVLMGYGTGAIMAVPAHDARDHAFARQFQLPVRVVVRPPPGHDPGGAFEGEGAAVDSANGEVSLDGLPTAQAKSRITAWLESRGLGRREVQYKLRDWLFSRQRYWGEPFPVLHGPGGEIAEVDETDLPVELPEMDDFSPQTSDDPGAAPRPPLARAPESWRIVTRGGTRFERELNTMPQWAGSCWYYLRFIDPGNDERLVGREAERYWMGERGVDLYVGGVEHAVLHLLYARFWHKVLYDLGHVSTPEPFGRLVNQGYIQAAAYRDARGVVVPADEVADEGGTSTWKGQPVAREFGKMGKSLKNSVSPDGVCREYGCDTLRLYEMYMGPLEASKPWAPRDIVGLFRFLQRAWRLAFDEDSGALALRDAPEAEVERALHRTIARVGADAGRLAFNTAIAALIEFVNAATTAGGLTRDQLGRFALVLAPFAPHMAEEIWQALGNARSLAHEPWPAHDPAQVAREQVELPVQVNGKVRARVTVPAGAAEDELRALVLADGRVQAALAGRPVRTLVVVPGKIVSVVAG